MDCYHNDSDLGSEGNETYYLDEKNYSAFQMMVEWRKFEQSWKEILKIKATNNDIDRKTKKEILQQFLFENKSEGLLNVLLDKKIDEKFYAGQMENVIFSPKKMKDIIKNLAPEILENETKVENDVTEAKKQNEEFTLSNLNKIIEFRNTFCHDKEKYNNAKLDDINDNLNKIKILNKRCDKYIKKIK